MLDLATCKVTGLNSPLLGHWLSLCMMVEDRIILVVTVFQNHLSWATGLQQVSAWDLNAVAPNQMGSGDLVAHPTNSFKINKVKLMHCYRNI